MTTSSCTKLVATNTEVPDMFYWLSKQYASGLDIQVLCCQNAGWNNLILQALHDIVLSEHVVDGYWCLHHSVYKSVAVALLRVYDSLCTAIGFVDNA